MQYNRGILNPYRFCDLLTVSHKKCIAISTWSDHVHPDELEQVMRNINDHLEGKIDVYRCA
jgi:hypothetical protein